MKNSKRCCKCKQTKPTSEFFRCAGRADGLQTRCKECDRGYASTVTARREYLQVRNRTPGALLERKRYKQTPAGRRVNCAYVKRRYHRDLNFRLRHVLRTRLVHATRNVARQSYTLELLGCSIPNLRQHLESKWQPGMSWENFGVGWQIDHRKACASFDLRDPTQQRQCFHFTNLQPLWAEENRKKSDK